LEIEITSLNPQKTAPAELLEQICHPAGEVIYQEGKDI